MIWYEQTELKNALVNSSPHMFVKQVIRSFTKGQDETGAVWYGMDGAGKVAIMQQLKKKNAASKHQEHLIIRTLP